MEAYMLCHLKGNGIPLVKSFGYNNNYNILVMELLGNSLEDLFQKQKRKFTLKTTCMLGIQIIDRIEWVHSKLVIHRDIKPDNFVMGRNEKNYIVYVLDFGLSKKYWSNKNNCHIKFSQNKKLTGTARYASINALKGCEQSRRDDLEAIGYVLIYFLKGSLPWQGLKVNRKEDRYRKIYEKKKDTSAEELCNDLPKEFEEYVKYTRNLDFESKPDYNYLRGLLRNIMEKNNYEFDYFFDWFSEKPLINNNFHELNSNNNNNNKNDNNDIEGLNGHYINTNENLDSNRSNDNVQNNIDINRIDTDVANYKVDIPNLDDKEHNGGKKKKDDKKNDKEKKKCVIF